MSEENPYENVEDFNLNRLFKTLNGLEDYTYKVYFGKDNKIVLCVELYRRHESKDFETEVIDDIAGSVHVYQIRPILSKLDTTEKIGILLLAHSWKWRKRFDNDDN